MSEIDVSQWKEFKLSSMFDICYGSFVPKKDRGTKTPFITTSSENNGISYYVDSDPMFKGDALTVASDGSVGATFYHDKPFSAGNIAVVLEPHNDIRVKWTPKSALFIATCIRKYAQIRHSWTDKYSVNRVRDTMLPLPVDSSGKPDWHYMDEYIAKRAALAHKYVSELAKTKDKPKPLNVNGWKEFKLTDLFNVKTGAYLSKRQLKPGSILRVTVSSVNNGIVGSFEKCGLSNERLFSNFLSVNFFGNVFYHDSLCSVDMKVHVLEPKHLYSKESMLFLVAVLRRKFGIEGYGTYGNQLSSSKLKMDRVCLPVDLAGNPDWQYMNDYVEFMKSIADRHVGSFQSIIKK